MKLHKQSPGVGRYLKWRDRYDDEETDAMPDPTSVPVEPEENAHKPVRWFTVSAGSSGYPSEQYARCRCGESVEVGGGREFVCPRAPANRPEEWQCANCVRWVAVVAELRDICHRYEALHAEMVAEVAHNRRWVATQLLDAEARCDRLTAERDAARTLIAENEAIVTAVGGERDAYRAQASAAIAERDAAREEVAELSALDVENAAEVAAITRRAEAAERDWQAAESERDALLAKVSEDGLRPVAVHITDEIAERLNGVAVAPHKSIDAMILRRLLDHFNAGRKG